MRTVSVYVNGPGAGRESALRALQAAGYQVAVVNPRTFTEAQAGPALIVTAARVGGTRLIDNIVLTGKGNAAEPR